MEDTLQLVVNQQAMLGESPVWDHERQLLYWVDILQKRVFRYHPETKINDCFQLPQYVGAVAIKNANEAIVAMHNGLYSLNLQSHQLTLLAEVEKHLPNNRLNDGKCDAYGRFWVGTMDMANKKEQGALYCFENNLLQRKLVNVSLSNGIAWAPDNQYMYHIDTLRKKVTRFDFHLASGNITNAKDVIVFKGDDGMPDGMTIDEEGMLWIAHWGGGKVSRWNPHTGEQIHIIEVPAPYVTSCTFGGQALDELYITTARSNLNDEQLANYPLSGGLFKIKVDVKGMPPFHMQVVQNSM